MKTDLGPFATLVSTAGSLMAAAAALLFTFRRRAKWEPVEQDVPRGAERVGGLLIAVAIAILWIQRDDIAAKQFAWTAGILAIAALLMLLIYGVFIASLVTDRQVAIAGNTAVQKIIGGFWLKPAAKNAVNSGVSVQQVLKGAGNDPDVVWTPLSRALAKMSFVLCYILLIATGTIALTCASLLMGKAPAAPNPPNPPAPTATAR